MASKLNAHELDELNPVDLEHKLREKRFMKIISLAPEVL